MFEQALTLNQRGLNGEPFLKGIEWKAAFKNCILALTHPTYYVPRQLSLDAWSLPFLACSCIVLRGTVSSEGKHATMPQSVSKKQKGCLQ